MPPASAPRQQLLLIACLTGLVLLLPTRNSTVDAWYYAGCVRHTQDLLLPHHLLYNVVGWLWVRLLTPLRPEPIEALIALNALAYGGILLALRRLLRQLDCPPALLTALLLLAGGSFGLLRFATENETYILPVLLSLLASGSWARYLRHQKLASLAAAGLWAAGACLLHQLHVWWWLGLLLGTVLYGPRGWRAAVVFVAPALIIPAAYAGALVYWQRPLTPAGLVDFALHDFMTGSAAAPASVARAALLTAANTVRTFAQVHGSTLALLQRLPWLAAVPAAGAGLLIWAWRKRGFTGLRRSAGSGILRQRVLSTHFIILLLHFGFAAWASGNAEFMVMLPVLAVILVAAWPRMLPARLVAALGGALLLWNLAFGLLPSRFIDYTNLPPLLARVQQEPRTLFLLDNHNLALNRLYYLTGRDGMPNVLPAPSLLAQKRGWTPPQLHDWLRGQQRAGYRLSTDAVGGPQLLDRARLMQQTADAAVLEGFRLARRDSFPTYFGPRYLTDLP